MHDIVDTAREAGSFTRLLRAVDAAGLEPTLRRGGPFTVFAPTDEAFDDLPTETAGALFRDETKLVEILTYHVVPGRLTAAEAGHAGSAPTVHGEDLPVSVDGDAYVAGARVVEADIEATNGVIHVIDRVLLPPAA
jgi:uncharacterized surface protein with fasciclin (FAS1) repeats